MIEATQPDRAQLHAREVSGGERFEFGKNWQRFLDVVDDARIREAELSLRDMLDDDLAGRTFLDAGSGSGLFSLASARLGAVRVHSFDFDPASVACTSEMRRRYCSDHPAWTIEEGSVLDEQYVASLGTWDVVYSWGVLHHTGDMWCALDMVQRAVAPGGRLFVSLYNDQGLKSRMWHRFKRGYNRLPERMRAPYAVAVMGPRELMSLGMYTLRGRPDRYLRTWTEYKRSRGMSRWHDIVDWIGGLPFEVAKPEQVFEFLKERDFELLRLTTCAGGLGCNQYVLRRRAQG